MIRGLRVPVHLTTRDALRMFDLADIWAARSGQDVTLVSGNDHIHTRGSAHYDGEALDFHSSDPDGLSVLFRQAGYRVLWKVPGHYAHVHVEKIGPDVEPIWPLQASGDTLRRPQQARPETLRHTPMSRSRTGG